MGRINRWLIRRAYNSGQWVSARRQAFSLLNNIKDSEFAQDIIIRSYWNEKRWNDVISFSARWPKAEFQSYSARAFEKLNPAPKPKMILFENAPPGLLPKWDVDSPLSMWAQSGERVWFRTPYGCVHFEFPEGYDLNSTNPALIELATEILLFPWQRKLRDCGKATRKQGENLALSFSCGVDSTAALLVMPEDTILAYHRRDFDSMLDHDNANMLISRIEEKLNREVIQVSSDHEKIRSYEDLYAGFSSPYAAGVHLILLADHLNLKGIAFGTPIDNCWLNKGNKYRDFVDSNHWKQWNIRFQRAGLDLLFPINMISEAGALRICQNSELIDNINSCLRGNNSQGCEKCWKCFHKNGPLGRPMDPHSKEITKFLATRPLKTAMHALWALQSMKLEHLVPDLEHLFKNDFDWWEKYYSPGFDLLPEYLREHVRDRIVEELEPMALPYQLEDVDLFPVEKKDVIIPNNK